MLPGIEFVTECRRLSSSSNVAIFFSRASDLRTATSQSSSLVVVEEVVNEMLFPVVVFEVDLCVHI